MKKTVVVWSLMFGCAQPVWAGHGTIHETDTEIVIEYSGDANDKTGDQEKKTPPGSTEQTEDLRRDTQQDGRRQEQEKRLERQRTPRTSGRPGAAASE